MRIASPAIAECATAIVSTIGNSDGSALLSDTAFEISRIALHDNLGANKMSQMLHRNKASFSAASCPASDWSAVLTRAYP